MHGQYGVALDGGSSMWHVEFRKCPLSQILQIPCRFSKSCSEFKEMVKNIATMSISFMSHVNLRCDSAPLLDTRVKSPYRMDLGSCLSSNRPNMRT